MTILLLQSGPGKAGGAGGGGGAESVAFLARTSGLDTTHTNAYTALIDGLVADGIWAKLDVLHVYATQDSTTALLNLVSTSFTATPNGSTFTADRGFSGVDSSGTTYVNTNFNPVTASSPKYTQNSAHLSVWNVNNNSANPPSVGGFNSAATNAGYIYPRYSGDGFAYFRINVAPVSSSQRVTNADASGHYIGTRSNSTTMSGYKNGSSIYTSSTETSTALLNQNMYALGANFGGTPQGVGQQHAMASIGSSLTSTDATNFYNRLRTYMTVVGVP